MGTECQQARDRSIVCKRQVNNARTVFLLRIKGRSTDARKVHTSLLKRKYNLVTISCHLKNYNLKVQNLIRALALIPSVSQESITKRHANAKWCHEKVTIQAKIMSMTLSCQCFQFSNSIVSTAGALVAITV